MSLDAPLQLRTHEPYCPLCGYCLVGLEISEGVRCPECGTRVDLGRRAVWRERRPPGWMGRMLGLGMLALPVGVLGPMGVEEVGLVSEAWGAWVTLGGGVLVVLATAAVAWAGGRLERWEAEFDTKGAACFHDRSPHPCSRPPR